MLVCLAGNQIGEVLDLQIFCKCFVPSCFELNYDEMCYVTLAVRCPKRILRNKNAIQESTK